MTCLNCGRPVTSLWARTDEWRDSNHCAPCLWGPLPGGGDNAALPTPTRLAQDPRR